MDEVENNDFKVSVIIPVYNAEKYLVQALNSAIDLEEVGEIILVEDRSPDNALHICKRLAETHDKVKLFTHLNNENRGASASRNLGINEAAFSYISFLDADDIYLPNRFKKDKIVFESQNNVDAVYSKAVLKNFRNEILVEYGYEDKIRERIGVNGSALDFYIESLKIKSSLFHTNSITFKKSFLLEGKLFDERLRLHQDSELWRRLLRRGHFFSGELSIPVAEVRSHDNNRITTRNFRSELQQLAVFINNVGLNNLFTFELESLFKRALRKESLRFTNNRNRRIFYYFNFLKYFFRKRHYLKHIEKEYNDELVK